MTGAVAAAAVLGATSGAEAGREHRSIDGAGNNATHREWGRAGMPLLRLAPAAYDDGVAAPPGGDRPGPRVVSNGLCAQSEPIPCAARVTDFLWQWGQFLDHDLDLTETMDPVEPFDIEVPAGDVHFDPLWTGTQVIYCDRSAYVPAPVADAPRQQLNAITAFIDASQVYGSDPVRAAALRTSDGTGRLATSPGRLLPFNEAGLPNAGGPDPSLFLAGDVRANEQVALTSLHTLFVREHNRLAGKIRRRRPDLSGDEVYERARAKVGALMQVITYREFLPALLGDDAISPYAGYDDGVDPGISNEFSTAAYRLGHSMLSTTLLRLRRNGHAIPEGHLALRDAFFAPYRLTDEGGIEPILRGLATQRCQEVDVHVVDDVRNFLFGPPGAGGFDLASLNIQRGRDHGLPPYNELRLELGLDPLDFHQITSDPVLRHRLEVVYGDASRIDAWVGGLAEDHVDGALVGELVRTILVDQFERLRAGDRFWYEHALSGRERRSLEKTTLADVIRRNTRIDEEIQDDVFHLPVIRCLGDANFDGVVSARDLRVVVRNLGQPGGRGDVNQDGAVDELDLAIVADHLGPCPGA